MSMKERRLSAVSFLVSSENAHLLFYMEGVLSFSSGYAMSTGEIRPNYPSPIKVKQTTHTNSSSFFHAVGFDISDPLVFPILYPLSTAEARDESLKRLEPRLAAGTIRIADCGCFK